MEQKEKEFIVRVLLYIIFFPNSVMFSVILSPELSSATLRGQDEDPQPVVCNIVGDLTDDSVTDVQKSVTEAMRLKQKFLPVVINSGGGCPYNALDILSWLKSFPGDVVTIVNGKAFSCAAIIFACGNIRYMSENATLMFHPVRIEDLKGEEKKVSGEGIEIKRLDEKLFEMVEKSARMKHGKMYKTVLKKGADWYLDAKQAKEINIANHIGIPRFKLKISCSWKIENEENNHHAVENKNKRTKYNELQ